MLLINAPEIMVIPVRENGQTLREIPNSLRLHMDLSDENARTIGYQPDFRLREEVIERLRTAAEHLPDGVHLRIKEGFRPLHVQKRIFSDRLRKLSQENPHETPERIYQKVAQYIAPPEAATHVTGGAVDVSLTNERGEELDLGTPYDAAPEMCGNRCYSHAADIAPEATGNRATLFAAMSAAGFVNYPFEWWHWSYGDGYWAYNARRPAAIYGPVAA